MSGVQRSARTQTPEQRAASARRAKQVIRSGGTVYKPKPKPKRTPQYGPTPQRVRAEGRERSTGQVIPPKGTRARAYVGSPKQKKDIAKARAGYKRKPDKEFDSFFGSGTAAAVNRANAATSDPRNRLTGMGLNFDGDTGGLGNFISNLGGDALDTITGLPSLAQVMAKGTAAAFPTTLIARGAHELGAPYTGWSKDIQDAALKEHIQVGKAVKEDYVHRYGPLARGDFGTFWDRFQEHPGYGLMDAAAVYSGAGVAARLGAKAAGAATGSQALKRIGSKSVVTHARPDRVFESVMGPNSALGRKGAATSTVRVPQRPYSTTNPFTRAGQKVIGKAHRGAQGIIDRGVARRVAEGKSPGVRGPMGQQARYDRASARQGRDKRYQAELERAEMLRVETRPYVQAVEELDKATPRRVTKDVVDAALDLHLRDMLNVPGKTPRQALDTVIAKRRAGLDRAVKGEDGSPFSGIKNKEAIKELDDLTKVPDELLDLKTGPPELRAAVEQGRALSRRATEMRVEAGSIRASTAASAPPRAAQLIHEGRPFTGEVPAAPKTAAVEALEKERNFILKHRAMAGARGYAEQSSRLRAINSEIAAVRDPLVLNPRNPYSPVGKDAVYVKDVISDRMKGGRQAGDTSGAYGRRTADKEYESHGTLQETGQAIADRGLPIQAMDRALVDKNHGAIVADFEDTFAYRRPKGKVARGQRAIMAMEADPANVILVRPSRLRQAARLADEVPEGEFPGSPFRGTDVFEGEAGLAKAREWYGRRGGGKKGDDLIALPKSAVEGMREGWDAIAGSKIKYFDSGQQLWKRGILSFFPRWYVNSLFGNTTMYGIATLGDFRAVAQAVRHRNKNLTMNPRVKGDTNVKEAKLGDPLTGKGTAIGDAIRKLSDPGLKFQASFDSLWREAMEIHSARKHMRNEGEKVRGMSDEDFIEAFQRQPKEVKNQVLRDAELALGDYARLTPWERATLRRVFPFYSWMRVIGKLTLSLPIRHPKRTAIIAAVGNASQDVVNPLDDGQALIADRGRVIGKIPGVGPVAWRTTAANPAATWAEIGKSVLGGDPQGTAQALASNLTPLGGQQAARIFSGRSSFGAPLTFAPGAEGTASQFGRSSKRLDPVTKTPDYFTPVSIAEQVFQTVPGYSNVRQALSGGDRPYDNITAFQIAQHRLGGGRSRDQLFMPPKDDAPMTPIPGWAGALGWTGFNFMKYDMDADEAQIKKNFEDWEDAQKQTKKRVRSARRALR